MSISAQITEASHAKTFIFGGKATFTLRSKKSGDHVSFEVKRAKDGGCFFIRARKNGDHGSGGFNYAGWMKPGDPTIRTSAKSHESTTTARKALEWALSHLLQGVLPQQLEVHHEGRCACCGRKLTDPVSIERGIGPECIKKVTGSKVIH